MKTMTQLSILAGSTGNCAAAQLCLGSMERWSKQLSLSIENAIRSAANCFSLRLHSIQKFTQVPYFKQLTSQPSPKTNADTTLRAERAERGDRNMVEPGGTPG